MTTKAFRLITLAITVAFLTNCSQRISNEDNINLSENGLIDIFAQDLYLEQKTNGLKIAPPREAIAINQEINLSALIQRENKISILRINDSNCTLCIEAELEEIKLFNALLNAPSIAIFATFKSKRSLKLMLVGLEGLNIPVFLLEDMELELPVDQINAPYYFTLTRDLIVNNTFIPIKGLDTISKSYFQAIADVQNYK